jgi:peptide/nickel transport system substrate-binding protein
MGSIGEPKRLLPLLASDSASATISGFIFNGLLKYDKDGNLTGDLASSWNISQDGKVITFHLRKGVKWQDGVPLTAQDVTFTFQKLRDPKVATPYSGDYLEIAKAEAADDFTFKVYYPHPFAPALSSWTMGIIPKHLLEKENLNTTSFNRNPVGTGPYKLAEWITGRKIVLEVNPSYFEGKPCIDRIIYRVIPDPSTMFMELRGGNLDYMGLTPYQYKRQTRTPFFLKGFRKFSFPSYGYTYLGYNLKLQLFHDLRVRRAITYAINRKMIVDVVLLGLGSVSTGPFPPVSWAFNPKVKPYPYNPQKARQLLREAGWRDSDGDGVLDKEGRPFEFTIITNQGNLQREAVAEIIQYQLAKVGIKVKIRVLEWQAMLHSIMEKNFQTVILGWSLGYEPDPYDIWHSSKTGPGQFNFVSYKNPQVDKLLKRARATYDKEKRKALYHKFHKIIAREQPYTFLYVPDSLSILSARFHGVKPGKTGIWYNQIRWYVPKEEQKYHFEAHQ